MKEFMLMIKIVHVRGKSLNAKFYLLVLLVMWWITLQEEHSLLTGW